MTSSPTPCTAEPASNGTTQNGPLPKRQKLHGRAFYESIGSPRVVLAPMVEQSEFAWRLLTRSFLPEDERGRLLAYTPMFHSRLFAAEGYRDAHFQPTKSSEAYQGEKDTEGERELHLDGNPAVDRPLTVQFCSNDPDDLLTAAKHAAPYCDAVDLNLGCPQGIARRGRYGSFLQEEPELIARMIRKCHEELDVPITAKMRVLETKEATLKYAKTILDAGASIITVHGRRREQKGHNTGLADWSFIRYLRDNLPKETVIFANGNILQHEDIAVCLEITGADAVMSAEGNLYDPTIFASPPPVGQEGREYWRPNDGGKGGFRIDAVMRRYLDIVHRYALGQEPPVRRPLWVPNDEEAAFAPATNKSISNGTEVEAQERLDERTDSVPPSKRHKPDIPSTATTAEHTTPSKNLSKSQRKHHKCTNPNLTPMQAHLFHLLRPLVAQHHPIRDALARCRAGDVPAFEAVLALVEEAVKNGIQNYTPEPEAEKQPEARENREVDDHESSLATIKRCKRPWWCCQPYVRPLPKEAVEKGSMTVGKKEAKKRKREEETENKQQEVLQESGQIEPVQKDVLVSG